MSQMILNIFLNGIHIKVPQSVCSNSADKQIPFRECLNSQSPRQYKHTFRPWAMSNIIRHSRLPAGNALWFCQNFLFFFFFFFFCCQGFRIIIFDRQAGPLQNFNRSHVMVIGRSVSFSEPARPPGGGVGRPKHPKIPPPEKKIVHAFQNPRNIFEKTNSREIFVCLFAF